MCFPIAVTFALAMKMPHWTALLAVVGLLQWLVFAAMSFLSHEQLPKFGLRNPERNLGISTAVVALIWLVAFDAKAVVFGAPQATASAVSSDAASGPGGQATCASVQVGMTGKNVKNKLGEPWKVLSEEDTRGPGAKLWFFKSSRCAVHMLDDNVEFID